MASPSSRRKGKGLFILPITTNRLIGLGSSLQDLSLSSKPRQNAKPTSIPVADSWDEEASSSSDSEVAEKFTSNLPSAPPPTPSSPHAHRSGTQWSDFPSKSSFSTQYAPDGSPISPAGSRPTSSRVDARPEKTTAVAGRLIAGALGVRTPAKSEENREYERIMKEKERKRRMDDKDAKRKEEETREEAKKNIWEG